MKELYCFLPKLEEWRDIPGYKGFYQVSDYGRVKSLPRKGVLKKRILKPYFSTHGYLMVGLIKNNKRETIKVHQLVAMAFLDHKRCGHKIVVDHNNNDRINNCLYNIQLVTSRENASKDKKLGTSKFTGVSFHKHRNKFRARIYISGKCKFLGYFEDEKEASQAYQTALKSISK